MKYAVLTLFMTLVLSVQAQHKLNLSAGFGYPSLAHGELGYQYKKLELSVRAGGLNTRPRSFLYADLNLRYHFMKQTNMFVGTQHYWTVSLGYGELNERMDFYGGHITIDYDQFITLRAGHHFELGDRLNFAVEAGPAFDITSYRYTDETYRLLNIDAAIKLQWELIQTENW